MTKTAKHCPTTRHQFSRWLLILTLLGFSAFSYAETKSYNIPAGPLSTALSKFAAEAGILLSADAELVKGKTTKGLQGQFDVNAAIATLLHQSGLSASQQADGTFLLHPVKADDQPVKTSLAEEKPLEKILVTSHGNLPVAYAGGQIATGGRLGLLGNTDVMDAPFSITSYTSEMIDNTQASTIADVIKYDPSVRAASSRGGMLDAYFIRGFAINNGNSGEIAMDGNYGIAPNYRALADYAERIEIIKGPTALLNGIAPNSGIGGSINIVPKRATEELTRITADYGLGDQAGGHIDLSRRFGSDQSFGIRFNGSHHEGDTYLDNQSRRASLGALALDYQGDRFRTTLDLIDQRENFDAPSRELLLVSGIDMPSAPDGQRNVTHDWEWSETKDQSVLLQTEFDINEDVMLFAGAGRGNTEVARLFGYPQIQNVAGDTIDAPSYMKFQTRRWTANAGLRANFATAMIDHQLTFQMSRYQDDFYRGAVFSRESVGSNIYDPVNNPALSVEAPADKPKLSASELSGVAIADTLSVWDKKLQFTVGARHQQIRSSNFNGGTGMRTSAYDESEITPMAGIVYKPEKNISLYANYIEGLSRGDIAPDTADNAGEAMAPYVAEQYEIGVKADFGTITTTASIFRITRPFGQVIDNEYRTSGEQRNQGLEISVFGEITPTIRVLGGLMLLDAEMTKTNNPQIKGNTPVGVADWQANLTTEWDLPLIEGLTLTGTLAHTDKQYIDTRNTQDIPSWTTLDIGVRYKLEVSNTAVTLRGSIQNITNEKYWSGVSSYSMTSLGAPRTALLSATIDL